MALHIFNESVLPDRVVQETFDTLKPSLFGHRVIAKDDGSFLDPQEFSRLYQPGDYQNGAVWPMFEAMTRAKYELHGGKHHIVPWLELFSVLKQTQFAEFVNTDPITTWPRYNPGRINHLWNATCFTAAKSVLSEMEQIRIADFMKDPKTVLYPEPAEV